MTVSRGWTAIDENKYPDDSVHPMLDEWAKQWSQKATEIENRVFIAQVRYEDGDDYGFENEEDKARYQARERAQDATEQAQLAAIEMLLEQHGARMMRPYEHWNEDERYIEYMETRYDC